MKKLLAVLLAALMVFALVACNKNGGDQTTAPGDSSAPAENTSYKVAMITDYGDITDESFNQTTYEACKAFCEENKIGFSYFKPAGDSTADRVAMIDKAVSEDYNVIVMPGYAFGGAIFEAAPKYPDVKFIALDVGKGDILETAVAAKGEKYSYNPDEYKLEDYADISNVYCAIYQEELCGYMAGYAAVKLGYEKLGFLGGMAVPAVVRYGYGFVQGVDAAAKELDKNVSLNYVYGGVFAGDPDITAVMDTWYKSGTEVVFACGGGIYTSAAEAAKKAGGKVIGVDVDQAAIIDGKYGEGITVTSAMKGLYPATYDTLKAVIIDGKWADYAGKIETLGLVSGDDVEANYVQIPVKSTQFADGKFTKDDYAKLVKDMFDGKIKVSNDITKMPAVTNVKITEQDQIK